MRYKKGSRVEIWSNEEVPSGCWRCGEIIFGNGRSYTVRYEGYSGDANEKIVGRVNRRFIRPCPPHVEVKDDWVSGEVLEVFHDYSWKMATVCKVLGRNSFVVRLVGSSEDEFKVRKSHVRLRQCWLDDKWIVVGKGFAKCEEGTQNERLNTRFDNRSRDEVKEANAGIKRHVEDAFFDSIRNICLPHTGNVSSRTLKRSSPCYSQNVEVHEGRSQKFLAAEKEGRRDQLAVSLSPQKVEAIAPPREMVNEKSIQVSSNNITTCSRESPTGPFRSLHAISVGPYNDDSISCSSGSSSVASNNPYELTSYSSRFEDNNDSHCSDAESFCLSGCGEELCLPPTKEELAEEIHRLELYAYRCTIMALHASGPLSWEKETLVTDLRISLHISNDEHLMELRNLISTS